MYIKQYRCNYLLALSCLFLYSVKSTAGDVNCKDYVDKLNCYAKGNQTCDEDQNKCIECKEDEFLDYKFKCTGKVNKHACDDVEGKRWECTAQKLQCQDVDGATGKCGECSDNKYHILNFDGVCTNAPHPCDGEEKKWECYKENSECIRNQDDFTDAKCKPCETKTTNFDARCFDDPHPCDDPLERLKCYVGSKTCARDQADYKKATCKSCEEGQTLNFDARCYDEPHPCDREEKKWECYRKDSECVRKKDNFKEADCEACEGKKPNFDARCFDNPHPCDDPLERLTCYVGNKACARHQDHYDKAICKSCEEGKTLNFDAICYDNAHLCDTQEEKWNCFSQDMECVRNNDFLQAECKSCSNGLDVLNFDARCTNNEHPCDSEEKRLQCYIQKKTCIRYKKNFTDWDCDFCADKEHLNFDGRCHKNLHRCDNDIERLKCYVKNETCVRKPEEFDNKLCKGCILKFLNFDGRCSDKFHPCDSEEKKWECYVQNAECVRDKNDFYYATCNKCPDTVQVNFDARCLGKHPCDDEETRLKCYLQKKTCIRKKTDYEQSECENCIKPGEFPNFDGRCHEEKHPCDDEIERLNCYLKNQTCTRSRENFKLGKCEPCKSGAPRFDGRCFENEHPCDKELERLKCYLDNKACVRDANHLSDKECKPCESSVLNFDGRCAAASHPCDEGKELKWECNEKNEQCVRDPNNLKAGECRPCPNDKPILNFDGICSDKKHPCDKGEREREICHLSRQTCARNVDDHPLIKHKCEDCPTQTPYFNFDGKCSGEKHPCDEGEEGINDCNAKGRTCTRDSRNLKLYECGACQKGKSFLNFDGLCSEEPHPCDEGQPERYECHKMGEQCLRVEDDPKKSKCVKCPPNAKYLNFDGKCGAQPHPCDEGQNSRYICNNGGKECRRLHVDENRHECVSCTNGKFLNFDGKCVDEKHPCDEGNFGRRDCDTMGYKCRRADKNPHKYECVECPIAKPHLNFDGICSDEKHHCDEGGKGRIHCNSQKKVCKREEKDLKLYRCVDCPDNKILNFEGTCSDENHPCDEGQEGMKECGKGAHTCKRNKNDPKSYECVECPDDRRILNFDGLCTELIHSCDEGQEGKKECFKEGNECRRDPADPNKYSCVKCSDGKPSLNKEGKCDIAQTSNNALFLHDKCIEELSPIFLIIIAFVVRFTRKLFL